MYTRKQICLRWYSHRISYIRSQLLPLGGIISMDHDIGSVLLERLLEYIPSHYNHIHVHLTFQKEALRPIQQPMK